MEETEDSKKIISFPQEKVGSETRGESKEGKVIPLPITSRPPVSEFGRMKHGASDPNESSNK